MINRIFALLLLCLSVPVAGQTTNHISSDELQQVRLPDVILESIRETAGDSKKDGNNSGYLEVKGRIGGTIRFELLLPENWNGRFAMGGGGGFVGTIQNSIRNSVDKGYATAGTDTGHDSQPGYMA